MDNKVVPAIPKDRRALFAVGALGLLSLIWGYNWVVMKQVLRDADPFDFSALRTLFGALALFAVLALQRRPLRLPAPGPTLLLGLLQTAAFTALVQWALVGGQAGKSVVLAYVMPFWLLPLAWIFLGERLRGAQWLAVALAGGGLLCVLAPWRASPDGFSMALALLAGLCWATSAIVVKRMRQRHSVELVSLTAWQMLLGALVLCALAWALPSEPPRLTPYFIGALAYNALLATGLGWLLWLYALDRLPAAVAGLSSLGVPAVGVLGGWVELGERPTFTEGVGMLLIAAAIVMLSVLAAQRR